MAAGPRATPPPATPTPLTDEVAGRLLTSGAPDPDVSDRIINDLGCVLSEATTNDAEHVGAPAVQAYIARNPGNTAAVTPWPTLSGCFAPLSTVVF
ncbi:hypothetical protein GCM10027586_10950 [Kineococcus gypseus]